MLRGFFPLGIGRPPIRGELVLTTMDASAFWCVQTYTKKFALGA